MGKIKKFTGLNIRKITGGKDPKRLVEEFLLRRGFDPAKSQKESSADICRWMISLREEQDLEILLEGLRHPQDTTVYLGVNIAVVPIRRSTDMLAAALEVADGLVGIKISLVGHYLVLSATMGGESFSIDDLEYSLKLIEAQQEWFCNALAQEMGITELMDT